MLLEPVTCTPFFEPSGPKHRLLRPAHLGRRHELHGRGDLPRVLRRGDAGPQLEDGGTWARKKEPRSKYEQKE